MIPELWDAITSAQGVIIVVLIACTLVAFIWGFKGWDTARSLRQIIELAPEVCEICASVETQNRHDPASAPIGTHGYVPARLVFRPSAVHTPGDTG